MKTRGTCPEYLVGFFFYGGGKIDLGISTEINNRFAFAIDEVNESVILAPVLLKKAVE